MTSPIEPWSPSMLADDVAVVTGGARGIGRACAERLVSLGASVTIVDLDADGAQRAAEALGGADSGAVAVAGDVRDRATFEHAAEAARNAFGKPVSIFVSNAGILRDRTMKKMSEDEWRQVLDVHLTGGFLGINALWGDLSSARRGAIVFISSTSKNGAYGQGNYASAKAGLVGLMRTVALEGAQHGIRSNAIAPGAVLTPLSMGTPAEIREEWAKQIPLGRWAEPQEIANAVAFLASPLASYITGHVLEVDGGYTIKG